MRRVEADLVSALSDVTGVRAIALMGSVAKGAPAVDADGHLASDVDALVVVPRRAFPLHVMRQGALQDTLTTRLGVPVSVAPLTPGLLRRAPPSVWFAEVKFGGKTIHGPEHLAAIPLERPGDVDPFQGVVVALNYLQELARVRPAVAGGTAEDVEKTSRALLGAADALAAATGGYDVDLRTRVANAARAADDVDADFATRFRKATADALRSKAKPVAMAPAAYAASWERANALLHETLGLVARHLLDAPGLDDRAALVDVITREVPAACGAQFTALRALATRRPGALFRYRADAVPRLWLALHDLTADPLSAADAAARLAPVLGPVTPETALDAVLDAWRAASPAYGLATPSRGTFLARGPVARGAGAGTAA